MLAKVAFLRRVEKVERRGLLTPLAGLRHNAAAAAHAAGLEASATAAGAEAGAVNASVPPSAGSPNIAGVGASSMQMPSLSLDGGPSTLSTPGIMPPGAASTEGKVGPPGTAGRASVGGMSDFWHDEDDESGGSPHGTAKGVEGLMYQDMELYCPGRKAMQVHFLRQRIRDVQVGWLWWLHQLVVAWVVGWVVRQSDR